MERDLEDDMRNAPWFMLKIKDKNYAQNVYAALCNMRWQVKEVMPILKDEYWTCSWRSAGGIVAKLRNADENYLDYYCSGMSGNDCFIAEGVVTDEVLSDLELLGWQPSEWPAD